MCLVSAGLFLCHYGAACVQCLFLCSIRGRHGGHGDATQQDTAQGSHMTSQTLNIGAANSRSQQSGVKRSKVRHAESRAR